MANSSEDEAEEVKAYAAATDNVGLFFGEDIFFAIGSIVLIQQTLGDLRLQSRAARAGAVGDPDARSPPSSSTARGCCCSTAGWRGRER